MQSPIRDIINQESQKNFNPTTVDTVIKGWPSASKPVAVGCADGERYVIKGSQNGKMLYNEYVCGRLGNLLNAPVAWVKFVEIPLNARVGELAHFGTGYALGSLMLAKASERAGIDYIDSPKNRTGFAGLAIMYSWCKANDHQLLYQEVPPHDVLSNDHGHFFPGGPNWTESSLANEGDVVKDIYFNSCNLQPADFVPFWPLLNNITDQEIIKIVNNPPEWGVIQTERDALASYLIKRRNQVQAAF